MASRENETLFALDFRISPQVKSKNGQIRKSDGTPAQSGSGVSPDDGPTRMLKKAVVAFFNAPNPAQVRVRLRQIKRLRA